MTDIPSRTPTGTFAWVARCGWKGLCPRCGVGRMFRSWLKIVDRCPHCDLDYRFASPDDGPALFSITLVPVPLIVWVVWLQVTYSPPWWVHLVTSAPLMALGTLAALRPIKGWLVASQYVNRAQQAGTERMWSDLNGGDRGDADR